MVYVHYHFNNGFCGTDEEGVTAIDGSIEDVDEDIEQMYNDYMESWADNRYIEYDDDTTEEEYNELYEEYLENGTWEYHEIDKERYEQLKKIFH